MGWLSTNQPSQLVYAMSSLEILHFNDGSHFVMMQRITIPDNDHKTSVPGHEAKNPRQQGNNRYTPQACETDSAYAHIHYQTLPNSGSCWTLCVTTGRNARMVKGMA
jgi:hypothetical protein